MRNILKPLIILGIVFLPVLCLSQKVNSYKMATDSIIRHYFSKETLRNITCDGYLFDTDCHGGSMFISSQDYRDSVLIDSSSGCPYQLATIQYNLYSKELNATLQLLFYLIDGKLKYDLSKLIPECVRLNDLCDFISRDSAI